ncbi:MAG: cell division protein ZapA [Pikeienuella sp.]
MAEVSFTIAGRSYTLVCDPGEESRLTEVARRVDREAQALMAGGGQLSEARLFMMTSLMLADKLDDAEQNASRAPEPEEGALPAADADILRQVMDDATARLDNLLPAQAAEPDKAENNKKES